MRKEDLKKLEIQCEKVIELLDKLDDETRYLYYDIANLLIDLEIYSEDEIEDRMYGLETQCEEVVGRCYNVLNKSRFLLYDIREVREGGTLDD